MDRIFPFIAVEKQNTNFNWIFSSIVGMELSICLHRNLINLQDLHLSESWQTS